MMPAYNAAAFIRDAIDSVLAQSYPHWELLVVNDGSTDATAEAVRGFHDPRVRLINKDNGGESTARNLALEHSRGEFIAYLDADDCYLPHHLAVTVAYLQANAHRDAVYTDGLHIDEHGRRLASLQSRRRGPFEGRLYEEVVRASDVFGPPMCVVLRHAVVAEHKLRYDPQIVIGPDWDFFVRFADLATFGYLSEQTGLYRVHRSNITAQVDLTRRAGYLALCREKAIGMASFNRCSVETRAAVLYELLVTLLGAQPERRQAVVDGEAFRLLPRSEQARLLRLMAADAVLRSADGRHVNRWLQQARHAEPADRRAALLATIHRLSPALCYALLRALSPWRGHTELRAPFADLHNPVAVNRLQ
jgi:hypothetical protein